MWIVRLWIFYSSFWNIEKIFLQEFAKDISNCCAKFASVVLSPCGVFIGSVIFTGSLSYVVCMKISQYVQMFEDIEEIKETLLEIQMRDRFDEEKCIDRIHDLKNQLHYVQHTQWDQFIKLKRLLTELDNRLIVSHENQVELNDKLNFLVPKVSHICTIEEESLNE